MKTTPLRHSDVLELHRAAISANIWTSRAALLTGLAPEFVASLPESGLPAGQLLLDLGTMNANPKLADGIVPLEVWLENARSLTSLREEHKVFTRVLGIVQAFSAEPTLDCSSERPSASQAFAEPPKPARSTAFRKLVAHLQQRLSPTADVTEFATLKHHLTDESRNVDVTVRAKVGDHSILISLECIEDDFPASREWVEQMHAKHAFLATNKLVLVSLRGFSEQAIALAERFGIATFTPEEATSFDWTKVVGHSQLFFSRHDYTTVGVSLLIDIDPGQLSVSPPTGIVSAEAGLETKIFRSDTGAVGTLGELITFVLHTPEFASPAMEAHTADGPATLEFDFTLGQDFYLIDDSNGRHLIRGVHVKVRAVRSTSPVPITSLTWNGLPAAFGAAQTHAGSTTLTVVEPSSGEMTVEVEVDGRRVRPHDPPRPGSVKFRRT